MTGTREDFSNVLIQLTEDCAKVIVGGGEARRGRLQASARFGTQCELDKVRLEWYASLPWLAFRAAMLTVAALPFSERGPAVSPCDTCEDRPCIRTCPAGAVREKEVFSRQRCLEQRLEDQAGCGIQCHSRLACPVGTKWRYPQRQLHYHGERSLRSLLAWKDASGR